MEFFSEQREIYNKDTHTQCNLKQSKGQKVSEGG